VERGVLTAYWLVSGYGLRAWRALAWLAGLTLAFGVAFHLVGFTRPLQPASYWKKQQVGKLRKLLDEADELHFSPDPLADKQARACCMHSVPPSRSQTMR
jgi:hypothetical protein